MLARRKGCRERPAHRTHVAVERTFAKKNILIEPLAEERAKMDRDPVVFGDDEGHFIAHAGIALVNRLPHVPDVVLAPVVAEMRQDINRRVGEEINVIAAKRQRPLDIAGIKGLDQIDHALPVKFFDHLFFLHRCWTRLAKSSVHSTSVRTRIFTQSIG